MATFNTTYNYNQPNMNFGQAMLYGAFGSLTGGMGGCMGMGMGMNGSIFSMMPGMGMMGMGGFGGYGMMGCYSDSMLGAQIGNIFSGCLMAGVGQLIDGRGGNSKETVTLNINTIETKAEAHLDILNDGNSKNYSLDSNSFKSASINDNPEYQKNIDDAQAKIDDVNTKKLPPLQNKLDNLKKPTQSDYKKPDNTDDVAAYEKALGEYNKEKSDLEAQIKALEDSIKETGELGKELKEAKEAKKAREAEIKTAINALKPLKDEYDELVAQEKADGEARVYDDADGNWLNRASKSSVEKYEGGECTKSQVRKAFNLFIEAKKSGKTEEASNWANKIQTMHNSNKDLFDNNYATAYKQVKEWLSNN